MVHKVRESIQHNFLAKVICLFVSIMLWLFVMNDQNPQIEGSYTVNLTRWHAPDKFKITQANDQARIRVKATRSYFIDTTSTDFRAYVNFDGAVEGDQELPIVPVTPQGFQVISIEPERTKVNLEPIIDRVMEIDFMVTGEAAAGMALDEVYPEIFDITLTGPKSNVESISRVMGYVSLIGRKDNFSIGVPLTAVDDEGKTVQEVTLSPDKVMVDVYLKLGVDKRSVPIQANIDGSPQTGFKLETVTVQPSTVEIFGAPELVDRISSVSTEKISVANENKTVQKESQLILPDGISVKDPKISVEIKISPDTNKQN